MKINETFFDKSDLITNRITNLKRNTNIWTNFSKLQQRVPEMNY